MLKTEDTSIFLNRVNLTAKFILYCLLWIVKYRATVILKVIRSFGKLEIEICWWDRRPLKQYLLIDGIDDIWTMKEFFWNFRQIRRSVDGEKNVEITK